MIQNTQGHHPGEQDADRAHLLDNERDVEQEEFKDQGYRLAFFKKVINFLKKVDKQVDGDEAGHDHPKIADEIVQDIPVEEYHGFSLSGG